MIVRIQQVKAEAHEWGVLIASTWLVRRPQPAVA
jgi:hypothetical protein